MNFGYVVEWIEKEHFLSAVDGQKEKSFLFRVVTTADGEVYRDALGQFSYGESGEFGFWVSNFGACYT